MAREYFCAFHSYLRSIEPLNDAERGRLFTACLYYSETGVEQKLQGNERFIFPTIKDQIDRDKIHYEETVLKNKQNGMKGGRPPKPKRTENNPPVNFETQKTQRERKGKGKREGEREGDIYQGREIAPGVKSAINEWLAYKQEKRQGYQPTGVSKLLTQVQNKVAEIGETAVIFAISESMACNYQGIIWDKAIKTRQVQTDVFADLLREEREKNEQGKYTDDYVIIEDGVSGPLSQLEAG